MKKLFIAIGIYCAAYAQVNAQVKSKFIQKASVDSSEVGYRKLKFEEANIVSSYYTQQGNRSAVTGGIGTESLFDIANSIDLKMSYQASKNIKHNLGLDINLDYYSSASSDNIDPRSVSGASKEDVHFYPSLSYSRSNEKERNTIGANVAFSTEWDYTSYGGGINYASHTADNNTEFTFKANAFFDTWQVILPAELRVNGQRRDQEGNFKARNSYNIGFGFSQVINRNLQIMLFAEPSYQEGLLSTPYHRIYFTDNSLKVEKLPGTRVKLPVSIRGSYFLGDRFVIRSLYRYYRDDWGMQAHTVSAETSIKLTPFISITPHYRFNSQTAVRYFAPYQKHAVTDAFYTSDYDISDFNSGFWGAGVRFSPPGGILGNRWWKSAEIRYGHYNRSDGMVSHIISLTTKID